nr:immunoglobulin heavy chain junction region [Macaca mulatta]
CTKHHFGVVIYGLDSW